MVDLKTFPITHFLQVIGKTVDMLSEQSIIGENVYNIWTKLHMSIPRHFAMG